MTELQPAAAGQDSSTNIHALAPTRERNDWREPELTVHHVPTLKALIVTKTIAGFSAEVVAGLSRIVRAAADGELALNFIVFDFAHVGMADASEPDGFQDLIRAVTDLILEAPVVSVACARGGMAATDLTLALACSMMISDEAARFDFEGETGVSAGLYRVLAQKLGFVRTERLIESGDVLDGMQVSELLLLKEVIRTETGLAGIEEFLRRISRRYNSCCGIYRAQRIATPTMSERLGFTG